MILLLTKFRISAALDAGKSLPASLRREIAAEPELEHFTCQAQALGRALRQPPLADPSLRDSIMRAVRASGRREQPRIEPMLSWLAAASAVSLGAVWLWLWMAHRHPGLSGMSASLSTPSLNDLISGVVQNILDHYPLRRC